MRNVLVSELWRCLLLWRRLWYETCISDILLTGVGEFKYILDDALRNRLLVISNWITMKVRGFPSCNAALHYYMSKLVPLSKVFSSHVIVIYYARYKVTYFRYDNIAPRVIPRKIFYNNVFLNNNFRQFVDIHEGTLH